MIPTILTKTIQFIQKHPLREELTELYIKNTQNVKAQRIMEGFIASLGCDPYEYVHLENVIKEKLRQDV